MNELTLENQSVTLLEFNQSVLLLLLLLLLAYYHHHIYLFIYLFIIIILFIYFLFLSSYSLLSLKFEIFDFILSEWVLFLTYPNLFGIKRFVVVVVQAWSHFLFSVFSSMNCITWVYFDLKQQDLNITHAWFCIVKTSLIPGNDNPREDY
jgi:hypothetical protein